MVNPGLTRWFTVGSKPPPGSPLRLQEGGIHQRTVKVWGYLPRDAIIMNLLEQPKLTEHQGGTSIGRPSMVGISMVSFNLIY